MGIPKNHIIIFIIFIISNLSIMKNSKINPSNASQINSNASNLQSNIESLLRDNLPKRSSKIGNSLYIINEDNIKNLFPNNPNFKGLKNWDAIKSKGLDKRYRSKMRSKLKGFRNDLLAKDRSMEERKNAKKSFLKFFEDNYASSKLESFNDIYQGNDENLQKDYADMIKIIHLLK